LERKEQLFSAAFVRLSCPCETPFDTVLLKYLKGLASLAEKIMEIPKYALDILVCPVCKTRVELLSDESGLKCVSCRRVYPVRDEIPVMLPEEAKIAQE
jgi:uncharacterized protein YbaR (Trm112 family)